MARKSKDSEADPDENTDADETNEDETPEEEFEPTNRMRLIGLGLIGSLIIGYSPLRDAMQGNGPFENAMFRFVACVVACVFTASVIGRILDGAPAPEPNEDEGEPTQSDQSGVGDTGQSESVGLGDQGRAVGSDGAGG